MDIVPLYENGIIKGLTEAETKEYESLEKEYEKYTVPQKPKTIEGIRLVAESEEYKNHAQIRLLMEKLEEKMESISLEEFRK